MVNTQNSLSIQDIKDDILLLKNGGGALVIKVSAVNFGLLSEMEQVSIIESFAQMLNSLSFSIQIVIRSQRLDISSYLALLDHAQKAQIHPLLYKLITIYRQFIKSTIKDNEVLDKQFYIAIPISPLELGIDFSNKNLVLKIKTIATPRRDQLYRQLNRVGLKAEQLTNNALVKLFFDIYNQTETDSKINQMPVIEPVNLHVPPQLPRQPMPQPISQPQPTPQPTRQAPFAQVSQNRNSRNHPFIVEELI